MLDAYFPDGMRRLGISGQALLAYSVSGSGVPFHVEVIRTDSRDFSHAAAEYLYATRHVVPSDWMATAGPQRRFLLDMLFVLAGTPAPAAWDPRADAVTVTAAPIARPH
jgi:hypothetical protein